MSAYTFSLLIFLLLVLLTVCNAHRAPDVAPDLPEGWCPPPYGKGTKTTGECICLSGGCEGPKCINDSGFHYFDYVKCPTCRCIKKEAKDKTFKPAVVKANSDKVDNKVGASSDSNDDSHQDDSMLAWLYDNASVIFIVIVAIFMFLLACVFILLSMNMDVDNLGANSKSK